ncbi:DegT/DnrJ/EryC1/StrS family aminotransferase [Rhizobium ruizarguesonis]|uniref:DegT/DnrJ/EryC1/StrS family aminotransferase n=1 Tax=Rhizobium ruizarguesonis TaxID=2081791 RepID=UPI0013EE9D1E|nr:DegT/DnrJ/EryC1/StrS family aminotransferase [Rhizobium ruizarguesonis]
MIHLHNAAQRNKTELASLNEIINQHCRNSEFILKRSVASLEAGICGMLASKEAVAVSSQFFAMAITLRALNIGLNDRVVLPAYGHWTTVQAVLSVGAKPVFSDVDPNTCLIDVEYLDPPAKAEVRAVIATSIHGQRVERDKLRSAFAPRTHIILDGNSALAVHAQYASKHYDEYTAVYSLNPSSTLGGIGEAGLIVTDNTRLARLARMLRNHGQDGKQRFVHHLLGFNSRMDDINAAVVAARIGTVEADNLSRRQIAAKYTQLLNDHAGILPIASAQSGLPSEYVITAPSPQEFATRMRVIGVEVGKPEASYLPSHPSLRAHASGNYPNAAGIEAKLVCLPFYPGMTERETDLVVRAVGECL